jgi:septal ring factor EnvC (AmiA/AmiB activator)
LYHHILKLTREEYSVKLKSQTLSFCATVVINAFQVCAQLEKEGKINFAHEYTRIFNAFRKAYMREEEFSEEIKALKAQVETSISYVASAERLAAVDKEEIDKLGHEINEAWKMVDSSHTREENSQQEIESLGQQIARLNKELEHRDRLALGTLEE